jgi:hypothetical protein
VWPVEFASPTCRATSDRHRLFLRAGEGFVHPELRALGDHALRLLDHDPANPTAPASNPCWSTLPSQPGVRGCGDVPVLAGIAAVVALWSVPVS